MPEFRRAAPLPWMVDSVQPSNQPPRPGMSNDEYARVIRSRQDYKDYEAELAEKRSRIANKGNDGRLAVDAMIADLDHLYDTYASHTSNAVIINADQHAFLNTVEVMSERARNQAAVNDEITVDTLVEALQSETRARDSRSKVLQTMGALFFRASKLAPVPWMPPTFDEVRRADPRVGTRTRPAQPPVGEPEEPGIAQETEFASEKIQRRTQGLIIAVVEADEEVNNYAPLLLYRLCFDKHSFVRTLENFFAVAVLVKERKLWIGSNKRGLPVVGSVKHRQKYLRRYEDESVGPARNIDLGNPPSDLDLSRQQFNVNLTYELYNAFQRLFGDEEPMLPRKDYDTIDAAGNAIPGTGLDNTREGATSANTSRNGTAGQETVEMLDHEGSAVPNDLDEVVDNSPQNSPQNSTQNSPQDSSDSSDSSDSPSEASSRNFSTKAPETVPSTPVQPVLNILHPRAHTPAQPAPQSTRRNTSTNSHRPPTRPSSKTGTKMGTKTGTKTKAEPHEDRPLNILSAKRRRLNSEGK